MRFGGSAQVKRRLLFVAAVVSFVVFVAAAGMWVFSTWLRVMLPAAGPGDRVVWMKVQSLDKGYRFTFSRGSAVIQWKELTDQGEQKWFSTTYTNPDPGRFSFKRAP